MVTSRRFLASFLVCIASLFLAVSAARGQVTTATLYGVVQDTSRAILPGVSVTVTHQGTNLTRETVTDEPWGIRAAGASCRPLCDQD